MLDNVPRYDMKKPPMRMHLRPLMGLLVLPSLLSHRNKLTKVNMEGIKPPYLLLCNHNAFMDMTVTVKAKATAKYKAASKKVKVTVVVK